MFFGGSMQHRKQSLLCYIVFLLNSHKELEGKKLKKEKRKKHLCMDKKYSKHKF